MLLEKLEMLCLALLVQVVSNMIGCHAAYAQEALGPSWWGRTKGSIASIAEQSHWDFYLSGYAHHSRSTYTDTRLGKLNEENWGVGIGKTKRNEEGNDKSLYVMVIRDSNRNLQWSAGYAYQCLYAVSGSGFELGAGLTAAVIRRQDWFDGIPFPAVLPIFSAGTQGVKLMATYVPKMSTRKGKGNVLFMFARVEF